MPDWPDYAVAVMLMILAKNAGNQKQINTCDQVSKIYMLPVTPVVLEAPTMPGWKAA
jgi:hypothetical protein